MPVIPFGGLSFFLNITIVVVGMLIHFFERRGFSLRWLYLIFSVITAKRFDNIFRRALGYLVMLSIVFFLFAGTGISFAKRMQVETNVSMIEDQIKAFNQSNTDVHLQSLAEYISI